MSFPYSTCYLCGDPISEKNEVTEEIHDDVYLGDNGEKPCKKCYDRMVDTDAREAADYCS